MAVKKRVYTTVPEVYEKLPLLNFRDFVVFNDVKLHNLTRTINTINSDIKYLEIIKHDDKIILRKMNPISFDVYMLK